MTLGCRMSIVVLLLCVVLGTGEETYEQLARQTISSANNAFSNSLYEVMSKRPGNIFFSPLSVHTVLSMVWLGAGGETAQNMASGLQMPADQRLVATGFKSLLARLKPLNNQIILEIANKIFAKQGAEIDDRFQKVTKRNFLVESEEVNFQRSYEAARIINEWVEQKTRNKIRDLISPDSLPFTTSMVLANAIYFKGKWLTQFEPQDTQLRRFYVSSKNSIRVPMMQIIDEFPYAAIPEFKAKALQMPYVGDQFSMLILLPDEDEGLTNLETHLASVDLTKVLNLLSTTVVGVSLPKFKLETTSELNEPLEQIGMSIMFGVNANFSGIAKNNLAVSRVVQKAFIEVTEEGSEASAATGVQIVALSGASNPTQPKYFNADHPFVFYIIEDDTGTVLFAGRFSSP